MIDCGNTKRWRRFTPPNLAATIDPSNILFINMMYAHCLDHNTKVIKRCSRLYNLKCRKKGAFFM